MLPCVAVAYRGEPHHKAQARSPVGEDASEGGEAAAQLGEGTHGWRCTPCGACLHTDGAQRPETMCRAEAARQGDVAKIVFGRMTVHPSHACLRMRAGPTSQPAGQRRTRR